MRLLAAGCAAFFGLHAAGAWAQRPPANPPSASAPSASTRTEILTFDSWVVTCREGAQTNDRRVCSAELQIIQQANNANAVVFSWVIGLNQSGAPASVLRFPTGVLIAPGVELKLGARDPRKIAITSCEPTRCEAVIMMDEPFIRDASAAQQTEAVVQSSDGRGVKFTINMKGFAQALATVRKP